MRFQIIPFQYRCVFKPTHFGLRIQMFVISWSSSSFPCDQEVKTQRYHCVFKWKHIRVTGPHAGFWTAVWGGGGEGGVEASYQGLSFPPKVLSK